MKRFQCDVKLCSGCPNFDYQWDSWGNNPQHICTAVTGPETEFVIDANPDYHNGFRILEWTKHSEFNWTHEIPSWCPLPDVVE
jgi:hypothetical protein